MKYWPKREKLCLTLAGAPESGWVPAQVCGVLAVGLHRGWEQAFLAGSVQS